MHDVFPGIVQVRERELALMLADIIRKEMPELNPAAIYGQKNMADKVKGMSNTEADHIIEQFR